MTEDIRAEVEREQALADLQRKVGGLEEELNKCREEARRLEGEKEGAGECSSSSAFFIMSCACVSQLSSGAGALPGGRAVALKPS